MTYFIWYYWLFYYFLVYCFQRVDNLRWFVRKSHPWHLFGVAVTSSWRANSTTFLFEAYYRYLEWILTMHFLHEYDVLVVDDNEFIDVSYNHSKIHCPSLVLLLVFSKNSVKCLRLQSAVFSYITFKYSMYV